MCSKESFFLNKEDMMIVFMLIKIVHLKKENDAGEKGTVAGVNTPE